MSNSKNAVDSDNFVSNEKQPLSNTVSPSVINSEKKMKLEASPEPADSAKADSGKAKANGTEFHENSLTSSVMWTSTENSFVQVNDKMLHRGIQTEQTANGIVNNANNTNTTTTTTNINNNNNNKNQLSNMNNNMLSLSFPNNLSSSGRPGDPLGNSLPNFQKSSAP